MGFSQNATSDFEKEKEYDISTPIVINVSAEDKSSVEYTIMARKSRGGNSAVIVSDTQKDIIPLFHQEAFFQNINTVLDKAYKADVPIYYIMLSSLKGFDAWNLPDQLHYYDNGVIVDKGDTVDAFETTNLHKEFLLKDIDTVYVTGVSSLGCVLGTTKGAHSRGYRVILVEDAHDEPEGYRTAESVEKCNIRVANGEFAQLQAAQDVVF
ncbi:MAG: cysteine hydrolase [Spirochaetales bacterium]|nr:cysteine hydrolase [Spirochaetales bacterium]